MATKHTRLTAAAAKGKSVAELEKYLDAARDHEPRPHLQQVMAIRNEKLRQEHLDYWGMTEKQYEAAKADARKADEPVTVHLNQIRVRAGRDARKVQSARAGTAGR